MSKLSRGDALEDISNWSTNDVLSLLRKNGLEECCKAIAKRQIDGDEFLHLTEGKLSLWKNDLTRPLIWNLWNFVEELRKCPEKYIEKKQDTLNIEDPVSDSGSWGTDFDDDEDDNDVESVEIKQVEKRAVTVPKNNEFRNSLRIFQENDRASKELNNGRKISISTNDEEENTYANCEIDNEPENTYANLNPESMKKKSTENSSKLHISTEKSLAEQLREQLVLLKNASKSGSTILKQNNENEVEKREDNSQKSPQPRTSFLHKSSKTTHNDENVVQKKMSVPPPPEPKKNGELFEKTDENSSKPPGIIRNFDLVANLPIKTEESEDEYESFDHSITEVAKTLVARVDSKQSLNSIHKSSAESVYQPNSSSSHQEEETYEIYESITETPEDKNFDDNSVNNKKCSEQPPPLPPKPPTSSAFQPSFQVYPKHEKDAERSPDKKSATLPHSSSNTSLTNERATRPLPLPPDKQSYMDKPWFHNVTREQATILIKEQGTYGNAQNGYFLLRPSTTNPNNPLALVLWYKDRVYNVPVRKRADNRFALGTVKTNEQSFVNVDEIVSFYKREDLVLYTGGVQMGSTRLTETPSK